MKENIKKPLIIVESPTKAKTIGRFLNKEYQIVSSYGHVRDLPKSRLGIIIEEDFKPQYIIIKKNLKVVNQLKKLAQKASKVILATDEDREGEAIAWHLLEIFNYPPYDRITFHEITPQAIKKALLQPRKINFNLVNAQQARRILDRLVGYELSPFLWKKVFRGLSAGRVQSAALRLIVDREKERENFQRQEYWTIEAILEKTQEKTSFSAQLFKINEEILEKLAIKSEKEAEKIKKDLEKAIYQVSKIETKEIKKFPSPPFTTSTLQQEAWKKLGFSAKQTMQLAQQLYEGIDFGKGQIGLITYMRTDSTFLSEESLKKAKEIIKNKYGEEYALSQPRRFKTKSKLAQEAHEAIRPTHPEIFPQELKGKIKIQLYKLYELIWNRFISCQMKEAIIQRTIVEIEAQSKSKNYFFKSIGSRKIFDGFTKLSPLEIKEQELPFLNKGEKLNCQKIQLHQHFTEPPPRYNEASLVKTLEECGIGRPSTYAPIISILKERGYVENDEQKRFYPTELGILVSDILTTHFPEIVDINFTAKIEADLDKIAQGKRNWVEVVKEFYFPFKKHLENKYQEVSKKDLTEEFTEEKCELCGSSMVIKMGRFGRFLACSNFPQCKNAKSLNNKENQITDIRCPQCQKGFLVQRRNKKGKYFYGCSRWPECNFTTQNIEKIKN